MFLGSAMAGAAAGGSLGSMYWNPAAAGQFSGLNTESSYILVLPNGDVHVSVLRRCARFRSNSGDIGIDAVTSFDLRQLPVSKDFWVGIAINSPFGLATKPENTNYAGSILGLTTKLLTVNANPMICLSRRPRHHDRRRRADGVGERQAAIPNVAGGYRVSSRAMTGRSVRQPVSRSNLPQVRRSASAIARSSRTISMVTSRRTWPVSETWTQSGRSIYPDIVTLSLRQEMTPNMRLLGTVQWENWSRFKQLSVTGDFGP